MNKYAARAILSGISILIVAGLACSQSIAGFQIGPTATPTVTNTPLPTATPKPTSTPSPVPTPTLSTKEICAQYDSRVYISQADTVWVQFVEIDQSLGKNFRGNQLVSTKGFAEASKQIAALIEAQKNLQVPSIFSDYNDLAVKALTAYKKVLDDAINKVDAETLRVEAAEMVTTAQMANDEWNTIGGLCGWPTQPAPLSS